MMRYEAAAVANYFLDLAKTAGKEITPMKMQKLVYFAHGWYLAIHGKPLIKEEVMAWKFGPVIQSLYYALKEYGSRVITDYVISIDLVYDADGGVDLNRMRSNVPRILDDSDTEMLLKEVWKAYGGLTAIQLSRLTHAKSSPWSSTLAGKRDAVIDNEAIKKSFVMMGESVESEEAPTA